MRVLQLGPFPPPYGGVQTNLVSIRNYLRANNHACGVINLTRHRREDADEVYYPRNAVQTFRLLATLPYDILHLHVGGSIQRRMLALAMVCCWMPGRKAVLTFHSGGYASSPEGRAASPHSLLGFVFRQFARIIAVNQEIVQLFIRFGVSQQRIRLIEPHSLPSEVPDVPLPDAIADFFRIHDRVLVTVGLLEPEYDLDQQIEMLGRLQAKYSRAGLIIIGSGSLEKNLRERIDAKDYAADILLHGDTPHPVTLRVIAGADLILRTTWYDGDAVSVREALHLGTPVIATDNGMRPTGVHLIPVSDGDALLAKVSCLLEGGKRERKPQAGDENLAAVLRLYQEL